MTSPFAGIRAVFFDAGMTLIQPHVPLAEAVHYACTRHGLATTVERFAAALSAAEGHFWARLAADRQIFATEEKIRELWIGYYLTAMQAAGLTDSTARLRRIAEDICDHFERHEAWVTYPDVEPALAAIRAKGYIMGVVSDWSATLTTILHNLGLTRHLDFVVGSVLAGAAKPSGHIFDLALRRANVRPEQAVHIGDGYHSDVLGARAAGLTPILLARQATPANLPPADCLVVHSLAEFAELLPTVDTPQPSLRAQSPAP